MSNPEETVLTNATGAHHAGRSVSESTCNPEETVLTNSTGAVKHAGSSGADPREVKGRLSHSRESSSGGCGGGGGGVGLSVAIGIGVSGFWVGLLGGVDRCSRGRESCLLTRRAPSAHASARENGIEEEASTGGASGVTGIVGERAAEFKAESLSPACRDGGGRAMNTSVLGTVTRSLGGKMRVITGDETGDDLRL